MVWHEHLFGIAAMFVCFIGYPCAIMAYCCCVVGGRGDRRAETSKLRE